MGRELGGSAVTLARRVRVLIAVGIAFCSACAVGAAVALAAVGSPTKAEVQVLGVLVIGGFLVAAGGLLVAGLLLNRWVVRPLETLSASAASVARGRLDTPIPEAGVPEIAQLGAHLDALRDRLLGEVAVGMRVGLIEAQDRDSQRIADQLHDDAIQILAAVQMRLEILQQASAGTAHAGVAASAADATTSAIVGLRDLMFELHPPSLARLGLRASVRDLLDTTFADLPTEVALDTEGFAEPPIAISSLIYRLLRQAILDAKEQRAATHVRVAITSRDGGIAAEVATDDGRGEPRERAESAGLRVAADIARAAGGRWQREDAPGSSTLRFWLPDVSDRIRGDGPGPDVEAPATA